MNLTVVLKTGKQSLPIILSTITTSLVIAYVLHRVMKIPGKISTLVGVGSSICGGSAIAATAPVIDADDEEVAQAISVIFLFNILAAVLFPAFGALIGFDTHSGEAFGIFAGTAVNDTSSVTAAASTWDSLYNLGNATLDKAVTVKLTRTLAIIPITLVLAVIRTKNLEEEEGNSVELRKIFPFFILYFVAASVITTVAVYFGVPAGISQSSEDAEQIFHCHGNGCNRTEHQCGETYKNRRKANLHGRLLLGRDHMCESGYAENTRNMVRRMPAGATDELS